MWQSLLAGACVSRSFKITVCSDGASFSEGAFSDDRPSPSLSLDFPGWRLKELIVEFNRVGRCAP